MAEIGDEFKPGEKVPHSGVYGVTHDKGHTQQHEVTAIEGRHFPPCRGCMKGVRFALVHPAQHIEHHEHFRETTKTAGS
jgi:hypothetical protein